MSLSTIFSILAVPVFSATMPPMGVGPASELVQKALKTGEKMAAAQPKSELQLAIEKTLKEGGVSRDIFGENRGKMYKEIRPAGVRPGNPAPVRFYVEVEVKIIPPKKQGDKPTPVMIPLGITARHLQIERSQHGFTTTELIIEADLKGNPKSARTETTLQRQISRSQNGALSAESKQLYDDELPSLLQAFRTGSIETLARRVEKKGEETSESWQNSGAPRGRFLSWDDNSDPNPKHSYRVMVLSGDDQFKRVVVNSSHMETSKSGPWRTEQVSFELTPQGTLLSVQGTIYRHDIEEHEIEDDHREKVVWIARQAMNQLKPPAETKTSKPKESPKP